MQTASSLALYYPSRSDAPCYQDRISVVMVTFNKYKYIRELLNSFVHLNYDAQLLDIVVVDNNSSDNTEELLRKEFGDKITIIQTGDNLGGSGGFNAGMKYVLENHDNEYIWLLDNDVVVHPDSLNWLLDCIKKNLDAAAVGSMMLQLDNPELINEIGASMNWRGAKVSMVNFGARYSEMGSNDSKAVEYCAAASLLKTRKSLEQLGLWQDFFIHFDDVEWCLRAQARGYKIYCEPKSIVFHESMNKKQPTWIKYYNIRNLLYLYASYKPLLIGIPLLKFSLWVVYFKLHGYHKNAAMCLKAIADFLFGKKRKQEFTTENYMAFDSYDWSRLDSSATCVFYDVQNFLDFIERASFRIAGDNKVVIYKADGIEQLKAKYPNIQFVKPFAFMLQNFFAAKHSSKVTLVFDGALEGHFMLPSFSPKLVVYPSYRTLLDLN